METTIIYWGYIGYLVSTWCSHRPLRMAFASMAAKNGLAWQLAACMSGGSRILFVW